jgi:hypothetical protein
MAVAFSAVLGLNRVYASQHHSVAAEAPLFYLAAERDGRDSGIKGSTDAAMGAAGHLSLCFYLLAAREEGMCSPWRPEVVPL